MMAVNQSDNTSRYPKRIPYGMMNFEAIIEDDCYYVDKTYYIEQVERANKFFFYIRPRRFGKSLTISMLEHYYDINEADKFEKLYGKLYIGQHPTPERNKYLVIKLNFAVVNAELHDYKIGLDNHCSIAFNYFCDVYAQYLPVGIKEGMNKLDSAVSQLNYICNECRKTGAKIYLFIDEYDHFTNKILAEPDCLDAYRKETHGEGYLRTFFDTIKAGTDSTISRVFVTGVSPVTLDDLTSGFNIGSNYALSAQFNEMTGFTESEVRDMLSYYATQFQFNHTIDELIAIIKPWYDNYCFATKKFGKVTMYNSNMVLYFVDNYVHNDCEIPDSLVDDNIRTDYNKLRMLIRHDKEFAHDASIIQQLVKQGYITGTLKPGFPAEQIGNPDNFVSLLFYFGMITIDGSFKGKTKFVIPNEVVREQLYTYLLDTYDENELSFDVCHKNELAVNLAYEGEWRPYFQYIADTLHKYSSQRDHQKGEYFVHGFTLAMTCQNQYYRPISEKDTQEGYADIFLCPLLDLYSDMLHSYIVELKYAKSRDTDAHIEQLRLDATDQVRRYAQSEVVTSAVKTTQLHKIVVIYRGTEMVVCEEVK